MTRVKVNISLPPGLAEAVKLKSEETSVPLSSAIQRLLSHWVLTGELPPVSELQAITGRAGQPSTPKGERKPKRSK